MKNPAGTPKILMVIRTTKQWGGTEKHVNEISKALQDNYCVDIVTLDDGFLALYRKIYNERYDIVHFFSPRAYVLGSLACELAFQHNRIMSRRCLTDSYQKPWIHWLEKLCHKRTKVLIGNSAAVVKQLWREAQSNKIRLIPNGVKPVVLSRRKLGTFVMTCVANAFPYKGHADLLAAIRLIAYDLPPWTLFLLGRGTEKFNFAYDNERAIIGVGFEPNVGDVLCYSDLFILPSHEEGCSNALLEAMAAGVPCIATSVGGNVDTKAMLVPPHDPKTLSQAILHAANNPKEMAEYAIAAKDDVLSRYSFTGCVTAYQKLYQEISHEIRPHD